MEKLIELSDTQRESFALQMRMAAASLVGQQVTWTDDAGADRTGSVSSVSYAGPVPTVKVGDQEVALDAVSSVATSLRRRPRRSSCLTHPPKGTHHASLTLLRHQRSAQPPDR